LGGLRGGFFRREIHFDSQFRSMQIIHLWLRQCSSTGAIDELMASIGEGPLPFYGGQQPGGCSTKSSSAVVQKTKQNIVKE
jgi:hypothetical protein